jgi:hypothetical protein
MCSSQSPAPSSCEEDGDNHGLETARAEAVPGKEGVAEENLSIVTDDTGAASPQPAKSSPHVQKRRRVTRACDECRRKKIKCDGKQPCTHCTVYSYGQYLDKDC